MPLKIHQLFFFNQTLSLKSENLLASLFFFFFFPSPEEITCQTIISLEKAGPYCLAGCILPGLAGDFSLDVTAGMRGRQHPGSPMSGSSLAPPTTVASLSPTSLYPVMPSPKEYLKAPFTCQSILP